MGRFHKAGVRITATLHVGFFASILVSPLQGSDRAGHRHRAHRQVLSNRLLPIGRVLHGWIRENQARHYAKKFIVPVRGLQVRRVLRQRPLTLHLRSENTFSAIK